jgi:hypothetical protein
MVERLASRRWSPEQHSLGGIYDTDCLGSRVATSKQAKDARIHHEVSQRLAGGRWLTSW